MNNAKLLDYNYPQGYIKLKELHLIDFDGVILDTINKSYKMIKDRNLITEEEIRDFYRNLDWEKLIIDSSVISPEASSAIPFSLFSPSRTYILTVVVSPWVFLT